jgi:hypothetical protein
MNENESNKSFKLFPNPSLGRLNIHFEEESSKNQNLNIFTSSGILVKSLTASSGHVEIDISDLPGGLYLLSAQTSSSIIHTRFFVTK